MEPLRKFKIIINSKECGTCSGPTPNAVAKKVVKKLCGTSSKVVKFSLKECKRGCERVCGPYQGRMEKLDRPCKRDGKTITHRVVCGKVRKMRGGRNLRFDDFKKITFDDDFSINKKIGIEPYIFFGKKEYFSQDFYNYAIFCESCFGGKVVIYEINISNRSVRSIRIQMFKDKDFITLLNQLFISLNRLHGFRRIKSYLTTKIDNGKNVITDKTVVFNLLKTNNITPTLENHQTILQNSCVKYPANSQFSGKMINGTSYNTNNLFRGIDKNRINRTLYEYHPNINKYKLLLTELDYLVNIYGQNGKLAEITYSGVFNSTIIYAGSEKIPITHIDYYLYCHENCSKLNLVFPCWIIFKKKLSPENNFKN